MMKRIFGVLFVLTGIFAIAGGMYTWGEGNILKQDNLVSVLIPWADIILTGPLSIACGFGILKKKYWSVLLGVAASGIYIFGSLLVFICMIWNNNFEIYLVIPAITGALTGMGYIGLNLLEASNVLSDNKVNTNVRASFLFR